MKIITVSIDEKGDSTVDLAGFNGVGCDAVQKAFADAIGKSTSVTHKPEFNKPCNTKTNLTARS